MTARILINIGNTHVQVGVEEGGGVRLLECYDTEEVKSVGSLSILNSIIGYWKADVVSVVPPVQKALAAHYGSKMRFLTYRDFSKLDFSAVDVSTLGMDRIANANAAYALTGRAVAVIDFGTCINTVVVDGGGRFLGGAIMPGRMMLRKSLVAYTAQLPLLPLRFRRPCPVGNNTLDALAAGVDGGVLGSVRELIAQTRQFLNAPDCVFLTAGGDARYFLDNIPELTPGPELITLRGLLELGK